MYFSPTFFSYLLHYKFLLLSSYIICRDSVYSIPYRILLSIHISITPIRERYIHFFPASVGVINDTLFLITHQSSMFIVLHAKFTLQRHNINPPNQYAYY